MSKQQRKFLGIVTGLLLIIFFCLTTKSFQGVNADSYPLLKTYQNVQVGNANYQLVNQGYNAKTSYLEMRFIRTNDYAEVNRPVVSAIFMTHSGQSQNAKVQLITNDFIVVQVKTVPKGFELGKIVITEKSQDAASRKNVTSESDSIYFSVKSLGEKEALRPLSKEKYMAENIQTRVRLLDKKINKLDKANTNLKESNKKTQVYLKELVAEKQYLVGTDRENTEDKIQSVQTEYEATIVEIQENQKEIDAYQMQKKQYQQNE
ncbi:hypothetical protein [Listeria booriae]|uniref:hypothetical protein n=1 Tax=Listeria booriae TaxID=1552123 RepID=UPI001628D40E|nr:hypothetical protein [Listeria booriae]MBC2174808.1 hypothetical protein [Listeria booriae]